MTSKILSNKKKPAEQASLTAVSTGRLMLEDTRQRSWLLIIVFAFSALLIPVFYASGLTLIRTEDYTVQELESRLISHAEFCIGRGAYMVSCGLIVSAFLAAISGFAYLHSRKKTDFYHSIAVRRERLFAVHFADGILLCVLPYMIAQIIAVFGVSAGFGVLNGRIIRIGMEGMLSAVLAFLAVYALTVLGMLISGRLPIGILMGCFFLTYLPLVCRILGASVSTYMPNVILSDLSQVRIWLSPLSALLIAEDVRFAVTALIFVIWTVAAFLVSLVVVRRRKSEAAGNALAFNWLYPVLKILICVPGAYAIGMVIVAFSDGSSVALMVLCTLLAAAVLICLMELVLTADFHNVRKHWKSGMVVLAASVALTLFITQDPAGINRWIPEEDDVSAMSFQTSYLDSVFGGFYGDTQEELKQLDQGYTENFSAIYDLARECVSESDQETETGGAEASADGGCGTEDEYNVVLGYRLKSGRTVRRQYEVSRSTISAAVRSISKSEDLRKLCYPTFTYNLRSLPKLSITGCGFSGQEEMLNISSAEKERLFDALREDTASLDVGSILSSQALYTITFYEEESAPDWIGTDTAPEEDRLSSAEEDAAAQESGGLAMSDCTSVSVYSCYTRTLQVLREIAPQTLTKAESSGAELSRVDVPLFDCADQWIVKKHFQEMDLNRVIIIGDRDKLKEFGESVEVIGYISAQDDPENSGYVTGTTDDGISFGNYIRVIDMDKFLDALRDARQVPSEDYNMG